MSRGLWYGLGRQQGYDDALSELVFGAIAYSVSTRRYGYSWNMADSASAEMRALEVCGAHDATVLYWARGGYLALAVGELGSYGCAFHPNRSIAWRQALAECRKFEPNGCRVVLLLHTRRGVTEAINTAAFASLIAGVLAWPLCPIIGAVIAVICGHVARNSIKQTGEGGKRMATAGLILGYAQLGIAGILGALWIIAVTLGSAVGAKP
jgi:hypothetical protein